MRLQNKIAEIRRDRGLTQEELAEKTGVARQTIIALEQGRYNPSLLLAHNVARALKQKSIEDVFEL